MQTFTEKTHVKELVRKGFFSHTSTHSIFLAKETNKLKLAYSIPEGRAKIGAWKFPFLWTSQMHYKRFGNFIKICCQIPFSF